MASTSDRENLIAAWQALGTSQPLCTELQNLCLLHMRRVSRLPHVRTDDNAAIVANTSTIEPSPSNRGSGVLLPPQRFARRARNSNVAPPVGPFKPVEVAQPVHKPADMEWANVPDGPTDGHQDELRDEMDQTFLAIQ